MADEKLVTEITKFAFLIRLASLLLIFFAPAAGSMTGTNIAAIVFVLATSAFGLYRNSQLVHSVSAHPILVMLDVAVASAVTFTVGPDSPILFYTLSTALLTGLLLPKRFALPVIIMLVASYLLAIQRSDVSPDFATGLVLPAIYVVLCALGNLTRSLHDTAMRDQNQVRELAVAAAAERERARLARDMHDSVAKSLHGIGLAAAALPAWVLRDQDAASEKAIELQHAAESAALEARGVLLNLRTSEQDRPLTELLRQIVDNSNERSGVKASFSVSGVADCDFEIKRELAGIASEALENVTRHSDAETAHIDCVGTDSHIVLTVRDDGLGFDTTTDHRGHYGLVGMTERAEVIGGRLELESTPGAGTVVRAFVPRQQSGAPL